MFIVTVGTNAEFLAYRLPHGLRRLGKSFCDGGDGDILPFRGIHFGDGLVVAEATVAEFSA